MPWKDRRPCARGRDAAVAARRKPRCRRPLRVGGAPARARPTSRLPDDRRNLVWFVFMVPAARHLLVEWEKEAPLTVAALRAEAGRDLSAPDYQELIADLLAGSPDFAAIWARQDVRGRREGLKRFQHPEFGRFDLEFASFQVAEQPTLRLSLYTPADDGRSETTLRAVITA